MMTIRHSHLKLNAPRAAVLVTGALCFVLRYAKIDMFDKQWQSFYMENVNPALTVFFNAAHFLAPFLLVVFAFVKSFRADMILLGISAALSAISLVEEISIYMSDNTAWFISIESSAVCLAAAVISIIVLIIVRLKRKAKSLLKEGLEHISREK